MRLICLFPCVLLFSSAFVPSATAGFLAPYSLSNFSLVNNEGDGSAAVFNNGATLVFTGPNDGSGLPGYTDLFTTSLATGVFQFSYVYTSLDDPTFDSAGYLLDGAYYFLADTSGESGTVTVPILAGEQLGFRMVTADNQYEPGILTVQDFSAPLASPEPGVFWLAAAGLAVLFLFRRSARMRAWRWLKPGVGAGIAALLAAASIPVHAQGQADYSGNNITGQLNLIQVVNLRAQAQPVFRLFALNASAGETRPKTPPPRLHPPLARTFSAFSAAPAAATLPASLTIATPGNIAGFNALSHLDQRLAYNQNQFSIEPPSGSIAVGDGYVLEGVNDAVQVYSLAGTPALPMVLASNQVFGLAPAINWNTGVNGVYLTDMRVYYDQGIDRWFVLQRSQDNDVSGNPLVQSHLYLAVSKTSDPTGDYNIYLMETTNRYHPGCPCIDDYPQIGSDQYGFHISWNEFNSTSLAFVDAAIMSVSKAGLASGAASPAAYQFTVPFTTGYEFAIQPATTPPGASNLVASGGVEYFVSSLARSARSDSLALWAVRNTSSLATPSPNLVLSRIVVPAIPYEFPDVATQRPGPLPYGWSLVPPGPLAFLDGGDTRVQSVSYAGGRLYLTLQTGVTDANNQWVAGAAYFVLSPALRNNALNGTVFTSGYLMVNGNHLLRPALAVNALGRGAIAVTLTGPDWFPTAALVPFQLSQTPSVLDIAGSGMLPEDGFTGYPGFGDVGVARWGDYNAAVAAQDGSIWMAAEYIGNYPRTAFANWNTYVMNRVP